MFGDLNRVELLGNITSDPELRYTNSGTAVLNVGLATNRRIKKGEEWVDSTDFHNVVFWGNLATNLAARMRKGTRIYVHGRLQTRSWEGDDGKKNYRTEVHVMNNSDAILISRFEGDNSGGSNNSSSGGAPAPQEPADMPKSSGKSKKKVEIDPDDLPF